VPGTPNGHQELRCDVAGRVATVQLNRPDKRNALTERMRQELIDCLVRCDADSASATMSSPASPFGKPDRQAGRWRWGSVSVLAPAPDLLQRMSIQLPVVV